MSEPDNEAGAHISRRDFFKKLWKGTKTGIVGVTVPHFILHEGQKVMEQKFAINRVDYFPMYELHDRGVESKIPEKLDVVFWELNTDDPNLIHEADPFIIEVDLLLKTLRQSILTGNDEALFLNIQKEKGRIALGDVGSQRVWETYEKTKTSEENKKEIIRFTAGLSGILVKTFLPDKVQKRAGPKPQRSTRREFLKDAALALGSVAVLNSRITQQYLLNAELMYGETPLKAMINVLYRLSGIASNARPEEVYLLYRNLVMADKLLLLGEYFSEKPKATDFKPKEHPRVGFKLGKAHQGIEDLLYLGRPVIQELLLAFYGQFMKQEDNTYGIDYLPKIRILKYEDSKLQDGSSVVELFDEATIVDQELLDKLEMTGIR